MNKLLPIGQKYLQKNLCTNSEPIKITRSRIPQQKAKASVPASDQMKHTAQHLPRAGCFHSCYATPYEYYKVKSTAYLANLNIRSAFFRFLFPGNNARNLCDPSHSKSCTAPKLQKNPQKNLPTSTVAGTVATSIHTEYFTLSQEIFPLYMQETIFPTAANSPSNKPGIKAKDNIWITTLIQLIFLFFRKFFLVHFFITSLERV